jgi:membrane fusion protein, multidrug efflux system
MSVSTASRGTMSRQSKIVIIAMTVLFGSIFAVLQFKQHMIRQYMANYTPPPVTVAAASAKQEQWDELLKSVGTIKAVNGVDITSQVGGLIREIYFASGLSVTENQVLVQLDDSVEQANLRSYDAQLQLAKINYKRDKKLIASRAISKTDFDTVEAKLKDAQAQVERTKALIEQKRILAPFPGQLGIRQLNVGDYVNTGDQLVTLQALDFLHVDFYVPEQHFPRLHVGQSIRFKVQAFGGRVFSAKVSAVNAKVDQKTRNILVRASFSNSENELLPGMFANVSIILTEQRPVVTVPQTAISYSLHGDSVFMIKDQGKDDAGQPIQSVERRYVTVADRRLERASITQGVAAGDVIVTAGQLKLNNGAQVRIDNSVKL